jgi:1-deoxy-D-xylulose-5-phosphate reductoisomerase
MRKKIAVLGATGSVGTSTLKVIEAFPDRFEIVLLTANRNKDVLLEQARRFGVANLAIGSNKDAQWLGSHLPDCRVVHGEVDLCALIGDLEIDLTVAAIVGAAGLRPTLAAIEAGSHIGLANKESMVVAGPVVNRAAAAAGIEILPIDSEHNALHQCLRGERHDEIKRLILTASGGPFRDYDGDFAAITREQALNHPTWDMGPKITIDSATMMNKGLEVIEAHHLFGFGPDQIDIVVHPQSMVHSLIETVDGSYKCQLGRTDMCDPIQYALTYPERLPIPFAGLDLTRGAELTFYPADRRRFPCIQLAYDALAAGVAAPAVLNAANEVAVAAFLSGSIPFTGIADINRRTLDHFGHVAGGDLDGLLALDLRARQFAERLLEVAVQS